MEENAMIGERSFGSDVNLVSPMVAAAVEGLQESGVRYPNCPLRVSVIITGERDAGVLSPNAPMVAAAVEGLQESGVSACLKHFPGLGNTTEDPHNGLSASPAWATLLTSPPSSSIPKKMGYLLQFLVFLSISMSCSESLIFWEE